MLSFQDKALTTIHALGVTFWDYFESVYTMLEGASIDVGCMFYGCSCGIIPWSVGDLDSMKPFFTHHGHMESRLLAWLMNSLGGGELSILEEDVEH